MTDARTIAIISEAGSKSVRRRLFLATSRQGMATHPLSCGRGVRHNGGCGCRMQGAPLTIPLNVRGWYRVSLGVWTDWERTAPSASNCRTIRPLRLLSRRAPLRWRGAGASPIPLPASLPSGLAALRKWHSGFSTLREIFWTCADLTGQEICIEQSPGRRGGWLLSKPGSR